MNGSTNGAEPTLNRAAEVKDVRAPNLASIYPSKLQNDSNHFISVICSVVFQNTQHKALYIACP